MQATRASLALPIVSAWVGSILFYLGSRHE